MNSCWAYTPEWDELTDAQPRCPRIVVEPQPSNSDRDVNLNQCDSVTEKIMALLTAAGPLTLPQLRRRMSVGRSSVQIAAAQLREMGLVVGVTIPPHGALLLRLATMPEDGRYKTEGSGRQRMLRVLSDKGPLTLAQIAEISGVSKRSVEAFVSELVQKEVAVREVRNGVRWIALRRDAPQ